MELLLLPSPDPRLKKNLLNRIGLGLGSVLLWSIRVHSTLIQTANFYISLKNAPVYVAINILASKQHPVSFIEKGSSVLQCRANLDITSNPKAGIDKGAFVAS